MSSAAARDITPYQLFMMALCVLVLFMLVIQTLIAPQSEEAQILEYADFCICIFFLVDFFISLYRAKDRKKYMLTWGWIDLISSIPVDIVRLGRIARLLRIVRLFRAVRATKTIAHHLLQHRTEGVLLSSALLTLLMLVFASIAILQLENSPESNIHTAEDALWWSFVTITTVGYGDHYPVTAEGRFLAAFLMITGVGLFGAVAGTMTSWFTSGAVEETDQDLEELKEELRIVRALLEEAKKEREDVVSSR
ncbi:pH-gated potassium channel KcsA [Polystyrenella longa]|uniref:pH-gated potassium channel KcsA n=1 Tax=Polystyrenella longa TaxID=2528007 RepID=A0A518CN09_9PLAN|nr:ion transporter [Polystyrenella longa]QDU80616.1 pH-gated potassium channel KcsA [Polystyrenella longa]